MRIPLVRAALLVFLAAGAGLGGCRGLLQPDPQQERSTSTGHRLVVRVVPPTDTSIGSVRVEHDNRLREGLPDSLWRSESELADEDGVVVFEDMVSGPTLVQYSWRPLDGLHQSATWGVVEIPRDTLHLDLSSPNLTFVGRVRAAGEALPVYRMDLDLRGMVGAAGFYDWLAVDGDSLTVRAYEGSRSWDCNWDFPAEDILRRLHVTGADSLEVPGSQRVGPDLERAWLDLRLAGEPLRNVEVLLGLDFLSTGLFLDGNLRYRPRIWRGDALPLYFLGSIVEVDIHQSGGGSIFPGLRTWVEPASEDTLRIDLGRNRVRLLLRQEGRSASFVGVALEPWRRDLSSVSADADEDGVVTLFLPDGRYEVDARDDSLRVVTGGSLDVTEDLEHTVELEPW